MCSHCLVLLSAGNLKLLRSPVNLYNNSTFNLKQKMVLVLNYELEIFGKRPKMLRMSAFPCHDMFSFNILFR